MKKHLIGVLSMIIAASTLLTSCGSSEEGSKEEQKSEEISVEEISKSPFEAKTYTVNTMEELRNLEFDPESEVTVTVKGYYEANDGGSGIFYWNYKSNNADNGGTIIKASPENGRFIRLCEDNYRSVKWFGAKGDGKTDDINAILAAINSLSDHGGTIEFPGGNYMISSQIDIGNGNAGDTWSSVHGIKLVGNGAGIGVSSSSVPTTITATKTMDAVISVNGLISGVEIRDMAVVGNMKAKSGVYLHAFCGLVMNNVSITQFTEKGLNIQAGEAPTGNYNIYNRFENVSVKSTADNSVCLFMDGLWEVSNDTWLTTFSDCSFDCGTTKGSYGAHFKFVDSISFYSCRFTAESESKGICFDARDNRDFPSGIGFYNCSVSSTEVLETSEFHIRHEYFYGFSTANGEEIPTHYKLIGITDTGVPFNMPELENIDGGETSSLPSKKGMFDCYTTGEWNAINLLPTKSTVAIRFNCGGKLVGGRAYIPNYENRAGKVYLNVYKWDTDYATTIKGEVVTKYAFIDFEQNTWLDFKFETPTTEKGEYLIVFSVESEKGAYGCGVWTQKPASGIVTYRDGYETEDFGIAITLMVE